jgi:hypothetical protein
MIHAKAKRKNVDKDDGGEKNYQKYFSCCRPKNFNNFRARPGVSHSNCG